MEYANGRMTAGLPGLLPQKRRQYDVTHKTRHVDRQNLRRQFENDFATTAPDGDRPVTSLEAQLGKPMTSQQVIQRLQKMNSRLHFETSLADPTKVGVYLIGEGKQFICGMERGFMPEFSVRHSEEIEMPSPDLDGTKKTVRRITRETRGWRTVLLRLMKAKIIRMSDVYRNFAFTNESKNWKELTT